MKPKTLKHNEMKKIEVHQENFLRVHFWLGLMVLVMVSIILVSLPALSSLFLPPDQSFTYCWSLLLDLGAGMSVGLDEEPCICTGALTDVGLRKDSCCFLCRCCAVLSPAVAVYRSLLAAAAPRLISENQQGMRSHPGSLTKPLDRRRNQVLVSSLDLSNS